MGRPEPAQVIDAEGSRITSMSKASTLYELQKLDLEIEGQEKDLAQVLEKLGDDSELQERRASLAEIRSAVEALEKRRKDLDLEAGDLLAKIAPLEKKLYSGQVRVPKELQALNQDVEMLKRQRRELEDAELEVMLELDDTQRQHREASAGLKKLEKEWSEEQHHLSGAKEDLTSQIEALQKERDALARQVDPVALDTYHRIREKRNGLAVVTLERGTCLGCRITIPSIEIQRARAGRELVFCQSCGRVLCVT